VLSDRHRPLKLGLGLAALLALGAAYAQRATSFEGGLFSCREDPASCDGARQVLPLYRVQALESDGFTVGKVARDVRIIADPEGVAVGDTVSVAGVFRAGDGAVVAHTVQHHGLRPVKKGLGILGLLLALLWAPRCFAWRGGRLVLRG
jgi:hypothetical protein